MLSLRTAIAGGLLLAACAGPHGDPSRDPQAGPSRPRPRAHRDDQHARAFALLARVRVGDGPEQICFTPGGATAAVALAGSNEVVLLDVGSRKVRARLASDGAPIGVGCSGSDDGSEDPNQLTFFVSRFAGDQVEALTGGRRELLRIGAGPTGVVGPLPGGRFLVSAERDSSLAVIDSQPAPRIRTLIPVGPSPSTPAVTSDGALACTASARSGSLTFIDLAGGRLLPPLDVGDDPRACVVLPGDRLVAVALHGEGRIVWVDAQRRRVLGSTQLQPGDRPTALAVDPVTGLVFAACTSSGAIATIAPPKGPDGAGALAARIPAGRSPAALAVHPSRRELWISCAGDAEVLVVALPDPPGEG